MQTPTRQRPTSLLLSTSTLQKGETPTALLQRACTIVQIFSNINHSSKRHSHTTNRTHKMAATNMGLAKVGL
jgi:hypothetical protein